LLPVEWFNYRKTIASNDYLISSMFPMNILANLVNSRKHIQFVFEPFAFFHDKDMVEGYPPIIKFLMKAARFVYGNLDIYMTGKSAKLMTVNHGVSVWIQKIYHRPSEPSYLVVDTKRFKPTHDEKLEAKYKNKQVVLHTTDYTPVKRSPFIIKHFKKVIEKIPNAVLVITTPREVPASRVAHEDLARKMGVGDNVEIVGFVPNADLPKYYSLADCAVYPGIGAGTSACSYFVLEVMSCKTPVVRTSDSVEEVIDGESGILFKPDKSKEMVSGIIKILQNSQLKRKMGENARKRIQKVYTASNVARNFKNVIKSVK
jgi:glycosyltransferase involved in cell wall biosynthesis